MYIGGSQSEPKNMTNYRISWAMIMSVFADWEFNCANPILDPDDDHQPLLYFETPDVFSAGRCILIMRRY